MAYTIRSVIVLFVFLGVVSLGSTCVGSEPQQSSSSPPDSTGGESSPDTDQIPPEAQDLDSKNLTPEERELLKYCKKVQEISDKQQETDRKLEEILAHVESLKNPPQSVTLDESKKKQLKQGWMEIEDQKVTAIKELSQDPALSEAATKAE